MPYIKFMIYGIINFNVHRDTVEDVKGDLKLQKKCKLWRVLFLKKLFLYSWGTWHNLKASLIASTSIYDINLKDATEIPLYKYGDFKNLSHIIFLLWYFTDENF